MKISTYNINGIRSAINKGFISWLEQEKPDVICLQELKAESHQVDLSPFYDLGYHVYWFSAEKKGYSGVAILSKIKPNHLEIGMGHSLYDSEGRTIRADFDTVSVMSLYIPSGSSGEERQALKMQFLDDFYGYTQDLMKEKPNLVISGDFNICHKPIDIHNPVSNKNSSGFLPEEREWLSKFIDLGFIDSFREFNADPHQYTWWSFRARAREKNLGWRIDYNMCSAPIKDRLKGGAIQPHIVHSDHCPSFVELD
jgi:exodeoxyribonuclease III